MDGSSIVECALIKKKPTVEILPACITDEYMYYVVRFDFDAIIALSARYDVTQKAICNCSRT